MERTWLREKRVNEGLTHMDVASKVGIKRQYYGMIEGGRSNPSVEVAKNIASVLGFEWTLFFEDVGNETLPKESVISTPTWGGLQRSVSG
jgi:transcriptional regulator with XRE-family HTH domain